MNDRKSCFLMGNRHTPSSIREQLAEVVEKHINEYGVNTFTVGHYGAFDSMAREVLRETKKRYEDITLYLLAPYALTQKTEIPMDFDGTFFPEGLEKVPLRYAIVQANRYMVQNSDFLISYSFDHVKILVSIHFLNLYDNHFGFASYLFLLDDFDSS